jgi:two-component system sporulation sensor kinase A
LNVINNAIQSMEDGGTVRVSTRQSGHWIVVRISDTGGGIPEDVMGKLFVPFFTTRKTGSGLGMAVTRRIIENHGGEIKIESELGVGTTVEMRVPIVRSSQEAEHEKLYGEEHESGRGAGNDGGVNGGST